MKVKIGLGIISLFAFISMGVVVPMVSADATCTVHTSAFGWEANALHNNGANLVLPITQPMHLTAVTVDYAMTRVPGKADGWREALTYLTINPTGTTGKPFHQPTVPGGPGWGASIRNGALSHGGGMSDRIFAQSILKNNYSGTVISQSIDYILNAGDQVWVHADAYGAATDLEAQGSITYCTI